MNERNNTESTALQRERDSPGQESEAGSSVRMPSGRSLSTPSPSSQDVLLTILSPRWRTPQEERAQDRDRGSAWGSDSCGGPLLRPCILHQAGPVCHPLCWGLLLLLALRILPGAHLLSPGLHGVRVVLDTHPVRILLNIWESKERNSVERETYLVLLR